MVSPRHIRLGVSALALAAAGCTAEIVRVEPPNFGLTDTGGAPPRPADPMRSDLGGDVSVPRANAEAETGTTPPVDVAALPPASPRADADRTITVEPGDTLYELAKDHGVTVTDLKTRNGLESATLRPGQKLLLPASARRAGTSRARPDDTRSDAPRKRAGARPPGWDGTYTMKAGDSLYEIARRYHVKLADLERVNDVDNPRRVRPGTVLHVPRQPENTAAAASKADNARPDPGETREEPPRRYALLSSANGADATPPPPKRADRAESTSDGSVKLRWPVQGKIVGAFGPRPDGTANDGVNIAVPMRADVHAAEAGTVAYAGAELQGYGNLVLVRHDNGWVTAYAHNSELLVTRGDAVMRGQVIARAGNTGQVDQPQVHFELRQASKPVDPVPFLENQ